MERKEKEIKISNIKNDSIVNDDVIMMFVLKIVSCPVIINKYPTEPVATLTNCPNNKIINSNHPSVKVSPNKLNIGLARHDKVNKAANPVQNNVLVVFCAINLISSTLF